jgi:carboxymethylenebutenolidase
MDAAQTPVKDFDADARRVLDYLRRHGAVVPEKLGVAGFCIGGHLSFRAALNPDVRATVSFYGTGIHDGKLGAEADAGSLRRAAEIRGELLLVWGALDPHVPAEGRALIAEALRAAGVNFSQQLYEAEHAFMRDEGARYDPQATDEAFGEMIRFYRRVFTA